ncbi:hypothetical protein MMC25_005847 [Agyrium rufum]|nr:hypothetical protein [Agyrium rufum]
MKPKKDRAGEASFITPSVEALPKLFLEVPKPKKKKKQSSAQQPQPAWLHHPDEENPVFDPDKKSEEKFASDTKKGLEAIESLEHKAYDISMKPAPPTLLLSLIGSFLASYGMNSTGRIFTLEREARKKIDGWNDEIGKPLDKRMPDLLRIFNQWHKEWHSTISSESSSEGHVGEDNTKTLIRNKSEIKRGNAQNETSSSAASNSLEDEPSTIKSAKELDSSNTSSGSTSSDSDADDEGEKAIVKRSTVTTRKTLNLKRKSDASSSSDSSAESDSDVNLSSGPHTRDSKKRKINGKTAKAPETSRKGDPMAPPASAVAPSHESKKKKTTKAVKSTVETSSSSSSSSFSDNTSLGESAGSSHVKGSSQEIKREAGSKKVPKAKANTKAAPSSTSTGDSSDSEAAEVTDIVFAANPLPPKGVQTKRKSSTDSTATLSAASPTRESAAPSRLSRSSSSSSSVSLTSSSSSSNGSPPPQSKAAAQNKKRKRPQPSTSPGETTLPSQAPQSAAIIATTTPISPPKLPGFEDETPAAKKARLTKSNAPFSRIPKDIHVDPKFASNAYIPNDYSERAHRDLIVTKGKGFTKEKNKKKRGSYRGGVIDVGGSKGFKFED